MFIYACYKPKNTFYSYYLHKYMSIYEAENRKESKYIFILVVIFPFLFNTYDSPYMFLLCVIHCCHFLTPIQLCFHPPLWCYFGIYYISVYYRTNQPISYI